MRLPSELADEFGFDQARARGQVDTVPVDEAFPICSGGSGLDHVILANRIANHD